MRRLFPYGRWQDSAWRPTGPAVASGDDRKQLILEIQRRSGLLRPISHSHRYRTFSAKQDVNSRWLLPGLDHLPQGSDRRRMRSRVRTEEGLGSRRGRSRRGRPTPPVEAERSRRSPQRMSPVRTGVRALGRAAVATRCRRRLRAASPPPCLQPAPTCPPPRALRHLWRELSRPPRRPRCATRRTALGERAGTAGSAEPSRRRRATSAGVGASRRPRRVRPADAGARGTPSRRRATPRPRTDGVRRPTVGPVPEPDPNPRTSPRRRPGSRPVSTSAEPGPAEPGESPRSSARPRRPGRRGPSRRRRSAASGWPGRRSARSRGRRSPPRSPG